MNIIEKILGTIKISEVSVATTIAVTCLGTALIMSVYQNTLCLMIITSTLMVMAISG